jgi:hypothetical protein
VTDHLIGVVIGHDPDNHRVLCSSTRTGVTLNISVQVRMPYGDGVRIKQEPLPGYGTPGIIVVPNDNLLNAYWLGAYHPSGLDAIHTNNDEYDAHIDYEAYFSGHWRLLDGRGNAATEFADGSYFTMGSSTALPTIYRHIVGANQARERVPFTRADRIPNPPSPFMFKYQGADGISLVSDGAGNVTGAATTLTLNVGGYVFKLDSAGLHYSGPILGAAGITAGVGTSDQVGLLTHKHPTAESGAPSAPTAGT